MSTWTDTPDKHLAASSEDGSPQPIDELVGLFADPDSLGARRRAANRRAAVAGVRRPSRVESDVRFEDEDWDAAPEPEQPVVRSQDPISRGRSPAPARPRRRDPRVLAVAILAVLLAAIVVVFVNGGQSSGAHHAVSDASPERSSQTAPRSFASHVRTDSKLTMALLHQEAQARARALAAARKRAAARQVRDLKQRRAAAQRRAAEHHSPSASSSSYTSPPATRPSHTPAPAKSTPSYTPAPTESTPSYTPAPTETTPSYTPAPTETTPSYTPAPMKPPSGGGGSPNFGPTGVLAPGSSPQG